ncbi:MULTISPECIES: hypothetical protein [unclassified Streptomyces]|uniref:hypothetical protein n=1 Tax=unclassified Streptomyces TaxID=2593676 RepID=UPI00093AAB7A|nr:hypothetical protein [Streptomyces sp. TSRI0281]OKI44816.1 hypothetical protein A6A29_34380 [Streptomyces sp. TSRI0281]
MGVIQDKALKQIADNAALAQALVPHALLLIERTYELEFERVASVKDLRVVRTTLGEPLFAPRRRQGAWNQVTPTLTRTEFCWEGEGSEPVWIDVAAELEIDVVAETDPGGIESMAVRAVDTYRTLDEFRAQFSYFDLDAFMASHGLTTVEDLRDAGEYLRTEVRLRHPPPFDPADPHNVRTVPVTAAVLVSDPTDVVGAFRAARLVAAATRDRPLPPSTFGVRSAPYALVTAFTPHPQPANQALSKPEITTLLTGAGIAPLFL